MKLRRTATQLLGPLSVGLLASWTWLHAGSVYAADLEVFPLHSQASVGILHGQFIFIEVYSGHLDPYLRPGVARPSHGAETVRLEWEKLSSAVQVMALRRVFPNDRLIPGFLEHTVRFAKDDGTGETLDRIARWFTGDSGRVNDVARECNCQATALRNGNIVRIPRALLLPELVEGVPEEGIQTAVLQIPQAPALMGDGLRAAVLQAPAPTGTLAVMRIPDTTPAPIEPPRQAAQMPLPFGRAASKGPLTYGQDSVGPYAEYRLRPGEVLYSDVVVRFTGRVDVYDVGEAADLIARRSGIQDPRELPAGTLIKIPLDLLEPEFLPPTDPQHQEYQAQQSEANRLRTRTTAQNLDGVVLVLDAGHGGNDPGTIGVCGLCEDEASYDVMVRVARIIETETQAKVLYTVQDRQTRSQPRELWSFPQDHNEEVLTSPHYTGNDTKVSANLRWYLANSLFRRLIRSGTQAEKVVFTSFHADARHPSAPGLMVYVPDATRSGGSMLKTSSAYRGYAEVQEQPRYSSTKQDRVRSEALSRDFAETLINTMSRSGVGVHSDVPIRGTINRRKRRFVPAVLRYNQIPVKLLIEMANLSSRKGCTALQDPSYRERVARAYVDGLLSYFGGQDLTARLIKGS